MTVRKRKAARTEKRDPRGHSVERWFAKVTQESDALDLESDVFTSASPRHIAQSLKRSAERSRRRKAKPFQSAMSMLNFYINRAGKNLPADRRRTLELAKSELRRLFGRPQPNSPPPGRDKPR